MLETLLVMKNKISWKRRPFVVFPLLLLLVIFVIHTSALAQDDLEAPSEVEISDVQESVPAGDDEEPIPADLLERIEALESELKELREQQEVRNGLIPTEEEKVAEEKDILSAAGRQYTLLPDNTLGIEYDLQYKYYSLDTLKGIDDLVAVEQRAKHTLTNSLFIEYAMKDNLTLNLNLPFVYKYDEVNIGGDVDDIDETDFGDISVGFQYQPLEISEKFPTLIILGRITFPTGRSPYDINVESELSTGDGFYSATAGASLSKTIDPVVAYGTLTYTYNHKEDGLNQNRPGGLVLDEVEPGDQISMSVGLGYALSYNISLNFSYAYSYQFDTKYHWEEIGKTESGSSTGSLLGIGAGITLASGQSIHLKFNIGLTDEDPDFLTSVRVPFEFLLD